MHTLLSADVLASPAGTEAERILRSCVHCGFCNATCPTYRLTGDELDGPRGRIWLIKQMLEGAGATELTRTHLDRCLTCRSCETTCPSGVEYSHLLEIGREHIERLAPRPRGERMLRGLLRYVAPDAKRVRWALRAAPLVRGMLPAALAETIPERSTAAARWPASSPVPRHARRMLALGGCVQAATDPHIDAAAARLLDRRGVSLLRVPASGCCGALSYHLGAAAEARAHMKRNIDAWWPLLAEPGVEAVIATSSACSLMLKDYGRLLGDDPAYGDKARRISELATDIGAALAGLPAADAGTAKSRGRIAFHAPCTLQHGLHGNRAVEGLLRAAGYELSAVRDPHSCCGAAGSYAIEQPEMSRRLRADRISALEAGEPAAIATSNIGCLLHLRQAATVPVKHWLELLDEAGH